MAELTKDEVLFPKEKTIESDFSLTQPYSCPRPSCGDTVRSGVSASSSIIGHHTEECVAGEAYTPNEDRFSDPQPLRPLSSPRRLARVGVDLCIACLPGYFLLFGALVFFADGTKIASEDDSALLDAARYGPTIFPILFAAVAANFLKATAGFLLERGTTIGSLEQLLASRTVASAVTSTWKFRHASFIAPLLLVFWALSPLGSQASLRLVSVGSTTTVGSRSFTYVDIYSRWPVDKIAALQPYGGLVLALITSAFVSPSQSKAAGQDAFSNLKIPIIESLSYHFDGDEGSWYNTSQLDDLAYASITGIPIDGLPSEGLSTFTIETSYMYPDCRQNYLPVSAGLKPEFPAGAKDVVGDDYLRLQYDTPSHHPGSAFPRHLTVHRKRGDQWLLVHCNLTTTFVEIGIRCDAGNCNNTAVRPSTSPHPTNTNTFIDQSPDGAHTFFEFFQTVVRSWTIRGPTLISGSEPIANYVAGHDQMYPEIFEWLKFEQIDDQLYSVRLSQLLNTIWINGVAALAVIGIFDVKGALTPAFKTSYGEVELRNLSIKCNGGWLTIVLLASGTAFLAGIAAAVMSAFRKGPDILDAFAASLRDHHFISLPGESSVDDGVVQARRLRRLRIGLCDVRPQGLHGHVAMATLDSRVVGELDKDRLYT